MGKFVMRNAASRKPLYALVALLSVGVLLAGGVLVAAKTNEGVRQALLSSPFIQHFKHTYNSLRKLSDIVFFPYIFAKGDIPVYHITIPINNLLRMNAALPDDPLSGKLEEKNKLYVKATFVDPESGYSDRVDIKYRGINANHWNTLKKSYRIQFPDGDFWHGQRLITFVTPYDRLYYIEPMNMYRAKKLGLISLDMHFARLVINGKDAGVYLAFEHWSPELLAKKGLPESKIFGIRDGITEASTLSDYVNIFDKEGDTQKEELAAFLELLHNADDETFKKLMPQLFDMKKLYAWDVLTILAGFMHQNEYNNTILYFNSATGKFEFIPWDINLGQTDVPFDDGTSLLIRRVLSIPEFRAERDAILRDYVDDPANLADDLAFYDQLQRETNTDFLKDANKFFTDFKYLSDVQKYREWVIKDFERARSNLELTYAYQDESPKESATFSGSFKDFTELTRSLDEFLWTHYQFYKIDSTTIGLSGTQAFLKDVIIPPGIKLVIWPGTTLLLDQGVSIFVHGSVQAEGTALAPITIRRLREERPWGTFAVINAGGRSIFSHVRVSGGSGAMTDGIVITGMLAFHASELDMDHSSIADSGDDDGLNVKLATVHVANSDFRDTFSDGIDLDFPSSDSTITGNTFTDIGGDAIDLSFSDVRIAGNTVSGCVDKGISVGEVSHPMIENNTITGCAIGIAVKDLSRASIVGNTLENDTTGIALYRKKSEFGGATVLLGENTLTDYRKAVSVGPLSTLINLHE